MTTRARRLWAPRLNLQDSGKEILAFLKRCQEHNLILSGQYKPTLFHAYQLNSLIPTEGLVDATSLMKFGQERSPTADQAKRAFARLLCVAHKAHFFLAPEAVVTHEPYVFSVPDLAQIGSFRYGMIYPLDAPGRTLTLVVTEWDLGLAASQQPVGLSTSQKFPVVLGSDHFDWLRSKTWEKLRQEAEASYEGKYENTLSPFWIKKASSHQDAATFPYGLLLNYDRDMKDDVKAVGARWAAGLVKWYLPSGWDTKPVLEYLDMIQAMSPQERRKLRWWEGRAELGSTRPGGFRGS